MADLLQEVDDAMRQERLQKIWDENKVYIIGVIVGTIVLTGILSGYRSWNLNVQERQTASIIEMQDAENYPTNILETEKLSLRAGLRGVALLQAAGAFLEQEDNQNAIALYERVGNDKAIPDEFRHLGILMKTRLMMNEENQDAQALIDGLLPVLSKTKSPWIHHAQLEAAAIYAHSLNDYKAAMEMLGLILDTPNLPDSLNERAQALHHIYRLEASKQEAQSPNAE